MSNRCVIFLSRPNERLGPTRIGGGKRGKHGLFPKARLGTAAPVYRSSIALLCCAVFPRSTADVADSRWPLVGISRRVFVVVSRKSHSRPHSLPTRTAVAGTFSLLLLLFRSARPPARRLNTPHSHRYTTTGRPETR